MSTPGGSPQFTIGTERATLHDVRGHDKRAVLVKCRKVLGTLLLSIPTRIILGADDSALVWLRGAGRTNGVTLDSRGLRARCSTAAGCSSAAPSAIRRSQG